MKKLLKTILAASLFIFAVASPVMAVTTPQTASAAVTDCEARLLGIPPWYRGLTNNNAPECTLKSPSDVGGIGNYIWRIVLNGIEMAVVVVAYIAIFFILYGGFLFITGGSNPSQVEKARKTITNALIGLVIAMVAIGINNLIFSIIT
jgi:heme A synthase